MSPRIHSLIALVTLTALVCLPSTAFADRSTSLQGNRLIEDADDVFTYPHLTTDYTDRLSFDFGTDASQGNALFLMGDESFTWGVALHRGNVLNASSISRLNELDALGPLAIPALPGYPMATAPVTAADLLLGFGSLGLRLSLGSGMNTVDPAMGDSVEASSQYANLAVGYGLEQWDLGLHVGFVNANNATGGDRTSGGNQIRAALSTRGYIPVDETTRLGVLGRASFVGQNSDLTVADDTTESSASQLDVVLGAGPSITLDERAHIAGYATLGFASSSVDPDTGENNDSASAQQILLPGANVAMEVILKPWLRVRAGMEYNHAILLTSQLNEDGADKTTTNLDGFQWNAGVGLEHKNFTLDGTLNPSFLTQGPDFIGGDGPLFVMLSASYRFGDLSPLEPAAAPTPETSARQAPPAPTPVSTVEPEPVMSPPARVAPIAAPVTREASALEDEEVAEAIDDDLNL
jgi:hypothetical protein